MFQFPRSTAFFWYGLNRTDAAAAAAAAVAAAAAAADALKQNVGGAATACERARALLTWASKFCRVQRHLDLLMASATVAPSSTRRTAFSVFGLALGGIFWSADRVVASTQPCDATMKISE